MVSQITIDALIYTNLILILSIGFTLTYMTARIPNFSHGTLAAVGCYVTFHIHRVLNFNPYLAMPVATGLVAVLLFGLYILVVRNLVRMGATIISLTISTIAIEIIIYAALNIYVEDISERTGEFARFFILRDTDFDFIGLPGILIVTTLTSIFLIIGIHLLLTQTKFGISMKATVENPELAEIMGINTQLIIAISWLLTGALAGLAGSLLPLWLQGSPVVGFYLLISVFAASILGGIQSIYGAMLGAFIVGITEVFGTVVLGRLFGPALVAYRLLIPLIIMAVILMIIPTGLSGLIQEYQSARLAREVEAVDV